MSTMNTWTQIVFSSSNVKKDTLKTKRTLTMKQQQTRSQQTNNNWGSRILIRDDPRRPLSVTPLNSLQHRGNTLLWNIRKTNPYPWLSVTRRGSDLDFLWCWCFSFDVWSDDVFHAWLCFVFGFTSVLVKHFEMLFILLFLFETIQDNLIRQLL